MSKKKEYVPPVAEVILLSPCEALASSDWAFGNAWREQLNWGKFTDDNGASGIAFGGSFREGEGTGGGFFHISGSGT